MELIDKETPKKEIAVGDIKYINMWIFAFSTTALICGLLTMFLSTNLPPINQFIGLCSILIGGCILTFQLTCGTHRQLTIISNDYKVYTSDEDGLYHEIIYIEIDKSFCVSKFKTLKAVKEIRNNTPVTITVLMTFWTIDPERIIAEIGNEIGETTKPQEKGD